MIVFIMIVVFTVASFILLIIEDSSDVGDVLGGGLVGGILGGLIGITILIIFLWIPFEQERYLAYTTEVESFEVFQASEEDGVYIQYIDRNGINKEFDPVSTVIVKEVEDNFRIETYQQRYTNEHIEYLFNFDAVGRQHIVYKEAE